MAGTWIVHYRSVPIVQINADEYTPGLEENQHGVFLCFRSVAVGESSGEHSLKSIFPEGSWDYVILEDAAT